MTVSHGFIHDASFWRFLSVLDEDLAAEVRRGGCRSCGAVLHSARYRMTYLFLGCLRRYQLRIQRRQDLLRTNLRDLLRFGMRPDQQSLKTLELDLLTRISVQRLRHLFETPYSMFLSIFPSHKMLKIPIFLKGEYIDIR